jgi:hypothetical protein
MAKATQSYQVTNADIAYNGKVATVGSIISDFPGEDIAWLLADGWIVAASASADTPEAPVTAPEPAADTSVPAENTTEESN